MGLFKIYYGKIWDENGEYITRKWFPKHSDTFKYKDRPFNVNLKKGSYDDETGILFDKRNYYYNISCSDPLRLDKKVEPIMHPESYNAMLETKVVKRINDINKTGIIEKLNFKVIIAVLVVLALGYLALTGNLLPT